MAVNELGFNQLATILNAIQQQATGQSGPVATDTSSFVTVGQTVLKTGYEPMLNAISQVLGRTIFSIRPYDRKFKGLEVDSQRWGNHVRKITPLDKPFEEDDRIKLVDGQSIDPFVVNKPDAIQTNFYGENVYQKSLTLFRDQLDTAFQGPEQFGSFVSMIMQNASDLIEQAHEDMARMTLANLIGAKKIYQDSVDTTGTHVVNLLTEYNSYAGTTLTAATVKQPANFEPFIKWAYAFIKTVSDKMTERSNLYHYNFGENIARHTPKRDQRLFIYSPEINNVEASVLSSVFHPDEVSNKIDITERVNFWQGIKSGGAINVTPSYVNALGASTTGAAQSLDYVFAVLMDREAAGVTMVNQWSDSIWNPRGGYSNLYWHFTDRYYNDFSENAVIFIIA